MVVPLFLLRAIPSRPETGAALPKYHRVRNLSKKN